MLGAIRENKVQGDPFRRRNSYGAPAAHLSSPSMHSTKWHPPRASGDTSATQVSVLFSRCGGLVQPFVLFKERNEGIRARIHSVLANFDPWNI